MPTRTPADDIAGPLRARQITPAAWMMPLHIILVPSPVLGKVTSALR